MRARSVGVIVTVALGAAACATAGAAGLDDGADGAARATVASRLAQYGADARARLAPAFEAAGVAYPPAAVTLLAIKDEARIEVWVPGPDGDGTLRLVRDYPVMAASGEAGPKLREGDGQVPEGVYAIDGFNPNSAYHLSMHVDYPNAFDRAHAEADGRTDLGGAIMIHGSDVSIGCLAMGDPAIEELFTLVADTGLAQAKIIIVPTDLRVRPAPVVAGAPAWTPELYALLAEAVAPLRAEAPRAVAGREARAPPRHAVVLEALGKGGYWGLGYEFRLSPRLFAGVAASATWIADERFLSMSPYVGAELARRGRHGWFVQLGPQLVHHVVESPVPEWDGERTTDAGYQLTTGWEVRFARRWFARTSLSVVIGRDDVVPWGGVAIGVRP